MFYLTLLFATLALIGSLITYLVMAYKNLQDQYDRMTEMYVALKDSVNEIADVSHIHEQLRNRIIERHWSKLTD